MAKIAARLLIPIILFLGGITLLALRIPGWSLFLGLPATQIGIIFLIFTFDEIAQNKIGPNGLHQISCSVCGKPTLAPYWQKEKICRQCRKKLTQKLKGKKGT